MGNSYTKESEFPRVGKPIPTCRKSGSLVWEILECLSNFLWQIIYVIGDFFVPLQTQNIYCKFIINKFKIQKGKAYNL